MGQWANGKPHRPSFLFDSRGAASPCGGRCLPTRLFRAADHAPLVWLFSLSHSEAFFPLRQRDIPLMLYRTSTI